MNSVTLRVTILGVLLLAAFSCSKEEAGVETRIIGIWRLTEKVVDQVPAALSECELASTLEFQENNLCVLLDGCTNKITNSGWNYRYDMLNISVQLPAAYYIEKLDGESLVIRRQDITTDGNLMVSVLTYIKID